MYIPVYFRIEELVPKDIIEYDDNNNIININALWELFDPVLLESIDKIREIIGVPIIINDWYWGGSRYCSGYRPSSCKVGVAKSAHRTGEAVDFISAKMTAKEIRDKISENKDKLPYKIRIEKWEMKTNLKTGVKEKTEINWVHIDTKVKSNQLDKIYFFLA